MEKQILTQELHQWFVSLNSFFAFSLIRLRSYVTFLREEDAARCIQAVDGCIIENRIVR